MGGEDLAVVAEIVRATGQANLEVVEHEEQQFHEACRDVALARSGVTSRAHNLATCRQGGIKVGIDFITVLNTDGKADGTTDRKSTRLNSSHVANSYAVSSFKKKETFEAIVSNPHY